MSNIDIKITVRGSVPRIPFERIAHDVLGTKYQLSLVLCGDTLAQRVNREYRKKTYYPNVLSFELGKNEGEMFLNLRKAAREARQYGVSTAQRTALLYVHGLFHLRGYRHGKKMEREEQKTLRAFGLA